MTDVTDRGDIARATAPRSSAALIVAATLAFVGAALTVGALFPEYWARRSLALVDDTGLLAQAAVFAAALILAGALMLGARSAPLGAAMLAVVVVMGLQPRATEVARLSQSNGPRAGTGFSLVTAGFVLALVSAAISALVVLRPSAWRLRGGARLLALLAALTGLCAAVGYGLEPYELGRGRLAVGFGTPLAPIPRQQWAGLLVVVVLVALAPLAVAVGGRLGTGLALGLAFGAAGIAALRLGTIYGDSTASNAATSATRWTWLFLAAAGASLVLTFVGLAVGARRNRRRGVASSPLAVAPASERAGAEGEGGERTDGGAADDPTDPLAWTEAPATVSGDDEAARVGPMPGVVPDASSAPSASPPPLQPAPREE